MNILLVTFRYMVGDRKDLKDGVLALHHFTTEWIKAGHNVTVLHLYLHFNQGTMWERLTKKPRWFTSRYYYHELDGAKIHLVETRLIKQLPITHNRVFMGHLARKYSKKIKDKPDIILTHFPTILDGFADKLPFDCPKAGILHWTDPHQIRRWGMGMFRRMVKGYDALGFRSRAIQRDLHSMADPGLPEFMVYSGAPTFGPPPKERDERGPLKVIYVGSLIERKGSDLLLRACHALPEDVPWTLKVVGKGLLMEKLEGYIKENGLQDKVTLTGPVTREEVLEHMADADMFVMLSSGETFGLVYLEAMSQKLITVGSKNEGIDGVIVDGENGFLLDSSDEKGLTALMERVYRMSPEERKRLREAAYKTASVMTEENMAKQYLEDAWAAAHGESRA